MGSKRGRRRTTREEPGLIEEFLELIITMARSGPLGFGIVSVLICVIGVAVGGPPESKTAAATRPITPAANIGHTIFAFGGLMTIGAIVWGVLRLTAANRRAPTRPSADPSQSARQYIPQAPASYSSTAPQSPHQPTAPRDGRAFERRIAALYRAMGYVVEETGRHGDGKTDGGIDLICRRPTAIGYGPRPPVHADEGVDVLIQCKDRSNTWVSVGEVREFWGALCGRRNARPARGVFITTHYFSNDARHFARENGIDMIDFDALAGLEERHAPTAPTPAPQTPPPPPSETYRVPFCPQCRSPMVLREPAPNESWRAFYGCSNYPHCRAKIAVR